MDFKHLQLERNDHIATITLNRPQQANALNIALMTELIEACLELRSDTQTRVVIFTGQGKNFCAGADLLDEKRMEEEQQSLLAKQRATSRGEQLIRAIAEIDQITISAINGVALGGGACIAVACDFRVGATDCVLGYPECNLGMNLQWGALPGIIHLAGPSRAKKMVILGKKVDAPTLLNWGVLDKTVPKETLLDETLNMAKTYAAQPPLAAQMIKKSVNHLVSALDQSIMHMDRDQFILTTKTEDFEAAIQAQLTKKKATFTGN